MNKQLLLSLVGSGLVFSAGCLPAQAESEQPCEQREKHRGFNKPRFADLDLDGDNFVTLTEFQEKPIPHGDHATVFAHIDADGNGEITQDEFESHRPPRRLRHQNTAGRGRD